MCGFLGRTLASSVSPIIDQFMTPPSVMPLSISQTAFLVIIRQTQKGMLTQTWKLWLIKLLYVQTLSFLINKFRMFVENFLFLKLCGDMKVMAHETGTCFGFDKKEKYNIRKSLQCNYPTLTNSHFPCREKIFLQKRLSQRTWKGTSCLKREDLGLDRMKEMNLRKIPKKTELPVANQQNRK